MLTTSPAPPLCLPSCALDRGCRYADNAPAIPKCGGGGRDPETAALAINILLQLCFHYVDTDGLRAAYAGDLGIDGLLQACLVRVARNDSPTTATCLNAQWRGYLCFICVCLLLCLFFFFFSLFLSLSPSPSLCLSTASFLLLCFSLCPFLSLSFCFFEFFDCTPSDAAFLLALR